MKNSADVRKKLAFLMGLSLCNNVIYIFNYNSFFLNISNFISILVLIYFMVWEKEYLLDKFKKIDKFWLLFMLCCVFSIVPASIYFIGKPNLISAYFNGIPNIILLLVEYYVIILLEDERKNIIKGITYGFVINVLFSTIQFILYQNKIVCSLYYLFPHHSFQVSGHYGSLNLSEEIKSSLKIYFFRAQGLFLETSYFIVFISSSILLVMNSINNKIIRNTLIILTFFLCLISESGNFMIIIFILILYYISVLVKEKDRNIYLNKNKLLLIPILLLIGLIVLLNNPELLKNVENTIQSTSFSDTGNTPRTRTILEGIELIKKYPLGAGYNMASKILKYEFPGETQNYIFSTLIINQLELGLIGNIVYIILSIRPFIFLLEKSKTKEDLALGISVLSVFICQISNGINYWNIQYMIAVLALANIACNDIKEKRKKKE